MARPFAEKVQGEMKSEFSLLYGYYLNTIGNLTKWYCFPKLSAQHLSEQMEVGLEGTSLAQMLMISSQNNCAKGQIYDASVDAMQAYKILARIARRSQLSTKDTYG